LQKYVPQGYEVRETIHGWREAVRDQEGFTEHIMHGGEMDISDIMSSPTLYQGLLQRLQTHRAVSADPSYSILNCSVGDEKNFWKFAAWPTGTIGLGLPSSQSITLETLPDDCWDKIQVDFKLTSNASYELQITPSGLRDPTFEKCSSVYTIGTTRSMNYPMKITKARKLTMTAVSDEKMNAINVFGLRFYRTCDSVAHILPDLWMTVLLFLGGLGTDPNVFFFGSQPTFWQNKLNPEFISAGTTYEWRRRTPDTFVDLDETQVRSGDFIIITRMDGVDQIIQWGCGSIVGHSVVLLEFDGEMYAIESQDGWYWPKHGIQRNPWKQWKQWALNAGFNVAILPLSDELYNQFNVTAAAEFFKSLEGYPYGYHNFIYGWIDKPSENVPPVTTIDFLYVVLQELQQVIPATINSFVGEGLNLRLNTKNLTLYEIYNVMLERGMTLDDLFGIPEQQDWIYSDGPSYVCSAFVAGVYKAGGLFGDKVIQPQEFTPRDVYQLAFYNGTGIRPNACKIADPDLPYCQIMGKFKMDITMDGWNTKQPYNNMFERCPSMPPEFWRPDDC